MKLRYYSKRYTNIPANSWIDIADEFPVEGPEGGRLRALGYYLFCDYQVDVTVANQNGQDMYRVFKNIEIVERDGTRRWGAPGDASRVMAYRLLGAERMSEVATIASGTNNSTGLVVLYLPMAKPRTVRGKDYAHGIDELRHIRIQVPAAADIAAGGSTINVDSLTYWVVAECVEDHDLELGAKDEVRVDVFAATTQADLPIDGKLHDLVLWKPGAEGGTLLSNLTDVRIDTEHLLAVSTRQELQAEYRNRCGVGRNLAGTIGSEVRSDPFAQGRALAVIYSDEETSVYDGPYLRRCKLNLTNTEASLQALQRIVRPPSAAARKTIAAAYGVGGTTPVSVKTESKTNKAVTDWERTAADKRRLAYMPVKVSLAKAA